MKVRAHDEAGALEHRGDDLDGGAGPGGALEHDELALAQSLGHALHGGDDEAEVRVAGLVERRGHADRDGVAAREHGVVGGGAEAARRNEARDVFGRYVGDVGLALGEELRLGRVHVEADDGVAGIGEADGEGQADVAEPDHADGGLARRQPLQQRSGEFGDGGSLGIALHGCAPFLIGSKTARDYGDRTPSPQAPGVEATGERGGRRWRRRRRRSKRS